MGKIDHTIGQGKEGIIPAAAYVGSGMNPGSPLTDDDGPGFDNGTALGLYAGIFGIRIPPVFGAAPAAFSCHRDRIA
ncbi:hypothetical protein AGMMS49944_32320 [Spirochaetia bacterium]|nr:hypothetical protein AGMMS49944_32320 [Spirochaetia bacterium]